MGWVARHHDDNTLRFTRRTAVRAPCPLLSPRLRTGLRSHRTPSALLRRRSLHNLTPHWGSGVSPAPDHVPAPSRGGLHLGVQKRAAFFWHRPFLHSSSRSRARHRHHRHRRYRLRALPLVVLSYPYTSTITMHLAIFRCSPLLWMDPFRRRSLVYSRSSLRARHRRHRHRRYRLLRVLPLMMPSYPCASTIAMHLVISFHDGLPLSAGRHVSISHASAATIYLRYRLSRRLLRLQCSHLRPR